MTYVVTVIVYEYSPLKLPCDWETFLGNPPKMIQFRTRNIQLGSQTVHYFKAESVLSVDVRKYIGTVTLLGKRIIQCTREEAEWLLETLGAYHKKNQTKGKK